MKSKYLRAHLLIVACLGVSLSACTLRQDDLNDEASQTNNVTNTVVTEGSTTAISTSTKGSMNTGVIRSPTNTMASTTGSTTSANESNSVVTSTTRTVTNTGTSTMATCTSTKDSDKDGLSDCEEALLGTNPNDVDTDGDNLTDFEEVQQGTNPNEKDSDGDGLDDLSEAYFGLDPNNPSTFGTGVLDKDLFIVKACDVPESEPVIFKSSAKGDWLMGLPVAFSNYTELHITSAGPEDAIAVYDDPVNEVSGFVISTKATNETATSTLVGYKPKISKVATITQDLIQGEFDTHDRNKAAPGEYRITVSNKAVNQIRNDLLFGFSAFTPADVTNLPTSAGNTYGQYYMQATVIKRSDRVLTTVALLPKQRFEQSGALRDIMNDLVNTTAITRVRDRERERCYPFPASGRMPPNGFLTPQVPISSTLRVYQSDDQGTMGIRVPRSRENGFDYFPQTNSLMFFGSFQPKASTYAACSNANPCVTPGESCKDSACVLNASTQVAVHYRYYRQLQTPSP